MQPPICQLLQNHSPACWALRIPSSTIWTTSATFSTITRVWVRTSLPRAEADRARQHHTRPSQQLTEIPALTESLNQLTSITSSSIDKGTELIDTTTKTLTASHQLLDTVNSTLRSVRSDADASTQTMLDGLLDVLDKASRSNSSNKLQNATDDIHNAIDDAKTDLEDDTNILNIDSSADLQSVTSSMNPTPSSLQFILRTQEISTDDDADAVTSDQDAADEGVLARIVNIFKKLASAIYGVFASEE